MKGEKDGEGSKDCVELLFVLRSLPREAEVGARGGLASAWTGKQCPSRHLLEESRERLW